MEDISNGPRVGAVTPRIPEPSRRGNLKTQSLTRTALLSYRTGANQPTPSLKAVTSGALP
jgi:hypothetical protein